MPTHGGRRPSQLRCLLLRRRVVLAAERWCLRSVCRSRAIVGSEERRLRAEGALRMAVTVRSKPQKMVKCEFSVSDNSRDG